MDTKQKKSIINKYLGSYPVWFDLRKKEILNDNINIEQWQINMNYLIYKHSAIDSNEITAFEYWAKTFNHNRNDKIEFKEYLEEHVTPVLLAIAAFDLPRIFYSDQDRNWFLAGYPDVFEYFYPQTNTLAEDFDAECRRVEDRNKAIKADYERMEQYLAMEKGNQTIYLVRMKNFYKTDLKKDFLLCR